MTNKLHDTFNLDERLTQAMKLLKKANETKTSKDISAFFRYFQESFSAAANDMHSRAAVLNIIEQSAKVDAGRAIKSLANFSDELSESTVQTDIFPVLDRLASNKEHLLAYMTIEHPANLGMPRPFYDRVLFMHAQFSSRKLGLENAALFASIANEKLQKSAEQTTPPSDKAFLTSLDVAMRVLTHTKMPKALRLESAARLSAKSFEGTIERLSAGTFKKQYADVLKHILGAPDASPSQTSQAYIKLLRSSHMDSQTGEVICEILPDVIRTLDEKSGNSTASRELLRTLIIQAPTKAMKNEAYERYIEAQAGHDASVDPLDTSFYVRANHALSKIDYIQGAPRDETKKAVAAEISDIVTETITILEPQKAAPVLHEILDNLSHSTDLADTTFEVMETYLELKLMQEGSDLKTLLAGTEHGPDVLKAYDLPGGEPARSRASARIIDKYTRHEARAVYLLGAHMKCMDKSERTSYITRCTKLAASDPNDAWPVLRFMLDQDPSYVKNKLYGTVVNAMMPDFARGREKMTPQTRQAARTKLADLIEKNKHLDFDERTQKLMTSIVDANTPVSANHQALNFKL